MIISQNIKEKSFIINKFEGPLDLLLFLIKKNKLDILEISLVKIVDQYIDYITNSKFEFHLDLASDYMLMASQLIEFKTKYLLKTKWFISSKEDKIDFNKNDLLEKLIEFNRYKQISQILRKKLEMNFFLEKEKNEFDEYILENKLGKKIFLKTSVKLQLLNEMNKLLSNYASFEQKEKLLVIKRISIETRINEILTLTNSETWTPLKALVKTKKITTHYLSITFLSILELTSKNLLKIKQSKNFSELFIKRKV